MAETVLEEEVLYMLKVLYINYISKLEEKHKIK